MQESQKRGDQCQSRDQEAAFDVEAHEAEVPIGDLAAQRTSKADNHRRKTDKGQREACEAQKVVRFVGCHDCTSLDRL